MLEDHERAELNKKFDRLWESWKVHDEMLIQQRLQANEFKQELRVLNKEISKTHGEFASCLRSVEASLRNLHDDFLIHKTAQEAGANTHRRVGDKWLQQYIPAILSFLTFCVLIKVTFFHSPHEGDAQNGDKVGKAIHEESIENHLQGGAKLLSVGGSCGGAGVAFCASSATNVFDSACKV
ncbi:hypothetical protein [Zhongshania sp.]|uniref:hypothetical protein n=1 Tax=Zhongshania sp. TaxID=1971902 RepID=UPI0035695222